MVCECNYSKYLAYIFRFVFFKYLISETTEIQLNRFRWRFLAHIWTPWRFLPHVTRRFYRLSVSAHSHALGAALSQRWHRWTSDGNTGVKQYCRWARGKGWGSELVTPAWNVTTEPSGAWEKETCLLLAVGNNISRRRCYHYLWYPPIKDQEKSLICDERVNKSVIQ